MSAMLDKLRLLRDEANDALKATEAYREFKVLDDAVIDLGGTSLIEADGGAMKAVTRRVVDTTVQRIPEHRKVSQADAAEMVLRMAKEPLPVGRLMEVAIEQGAEIGGANGLNNFRTVLSRDARFRPVKRNNASFWWLTDEPLSPSWNEPPPNDFEALLGDGPSVSSSSKGGDGDAPPTT